MKDTGGPKKLKPDASNTIVLNLPQYAPIIIKPFDEEQGSYIAHLYAITQCPRFGVLLPFRLFPVPYAQVTVLGVRVMSEEHIELYKDF